MQWLQVHAPFLMQGNGLKARMEIWKTSDVPLPMYTNTPAGATKTKDFHASMPDQARKATTSTSKGQ